MMTDHDQYILNTLDNLLLYARDAGREPVHFTIHRDDWLSLKNNLAANLVPDPSDFGTNTYKGVPVHFHAGGNNHVYFVDTAGQRHPEDPSNNSA